MDINREYYPAVEQFLRQLDGMRVQSVCMIALVDEEDAFDVYVSYNAGAMELCTCAGILQMHAAREYIEITKEQEDEDEP